MAEIKAPMAGTILEILVAVGDDAAEGDELLILESMKMEIPVEAPCAGTISEIRVAEGDSIEEGMILAMIT